MSTCSCARAGPRRRVAQALRRGTPLLFEALLDDDEGWQPVHAVGSPVERPDGVELLVNAPVEGTVAISETTWPPPWGPLTALLTITR
jgi:hypothetical protein